MALVVLLLARQPHLPPSFLWLFSCPTLQIPRPVACPENLRFWPRPGGSPRSAGPAQAVLQHAAFPSGYQEGLCCARRLVSTNTDRNAVFLRLLFSKLARNVDDVSKGVMTMMLGCQFSLRRQICT